MDQDKNSTPNAPIAPTQTGSLNKEAEPLVEVSDKGPEISSELADYISKSEPTPPQNEKIGVKISPDALTPATSPSASVQLPTIPALKTQAKVIPILGGKRWITEETIREELKDLKAA